MASHTKINTYMERHKIGPLFEDLMNKVLRDMPEEPMVYLLRAMYKKAGIEIPQGIRYGGLRKSTSELRSQSPERPLRSAQVSSSTDPVGASRDYERPWASPSAKRLKPKKSEEPSGSSKKKPDWNPDNKTKSTPLDDFWDSSEQPLKGKEKSGTRKSLAKSAGHGASAWASVGLEDGEDVYTSPPSQTVHGRRPPRQSEEELLANEAVPLSLRSKYGAKDLSGAGAPARNIRNPRLAAEKHRQELSQMVEDSKGGHSVPSHLDLGNLGGDEDAIDMLENADDLKREGVTNIPQTGYKLSRAMRHRENEPRVKLSINVNQSNDRDHDWSFWQDGRASRDPYDTSGQPSSDLQDSDDEFESVSQVTGPRQPVWNVPDSDAESLHPSHSRTAKHEADAKEHTQSFTERSLDRSSPASFTNRSVRNTGDLPLARRTWDVSENRSVSFQNPNSGPQSNQSVLSQSTSGGWVVPDDTEVASAHDWNQRVKGGSPQDPRSY